DRAQEPAHRDDEREVFLQRALALDDDVRDALDARRRRRRFSLCRQGMLEAVTAFELDQKHAAAPASRLERERERDRGAADAALADREDEAAPQELVEGHRVPAPRPEPSPARRSTRHAFVPPKPNEFDSAIATRAARAWFGT